MLHLQGQVMNVLVTPTGRNAEGKEYGGTDQVQLMCEEALRNGEKRMALFTLRTDNLDEFRKLIGQQVRVPVGVFAKGNALTFYMQKTGGIERVAAG